MNYNSVRQKIADQKIIKMIELLSLSHNSQRAAAYIELAIVIPIFVLIGYSAFELSRLYNATEAISTLSNEAARLGHKECENETTGASMTICLTNRVMPHMNTFLASALPGAEVIISAYRLDAGGGSVSQLAAVGLNAPVGANPAMTNHGNQSRFNDAFATNLTLNNRDAAGILVQSSLIAGDKETIIVGEVYYNHSIIVHPLWTAIFPGVLYEATIL